MERLDHDLLPLVLKDAFYRQNPGLWNGEPIDNVDRATLMACALVNSCWRNLAQPLLFRWVNTNWRFFSFFLRNTADEHALGLLCHVRVVRVGHDALHGPSNTVATLLERCPHLVHLTFDWDGAKLTSEAMMSRLRGIAKTKPFGISSLRILPGSGLDLERPSPARFYQLVVLFESLKSLWLAPGIVGAVLSQSRGLQFKSQLHDLRIEDTQIHESSLRWLLQSSHTSLRLVDFQFGLTIDGHMWVADALRPCCSSIRSLRFRTAFTQASADIVQMCPRLEELIIDLGHNGRHLTLPMFHRSSKLRHLLICILDFVPSSSVPTVAQSLLDFIHTQDSLYTLRLWGGWMTLMGNHQDILFSLMDTCTANKIDLELKECMAWADDVYTIAQTPRHEGSAKYLV